MAHQTLRLGKCWKLFRATLTMVLPVLKTEFCFSFTLLKLIKASYDWRWYTIPLVDLSLQVIDIRNICRLTVKTSSQILWLLRSFGLYIKSYCVTM